MRKFFLLYLMSCVFVSFPKSILACSVCFGDPSSLQSKALGGAVFFLLAVVGGVLAAIAFLAFTWSRRAKKLNEIAHTALS